MGSASPCASPWPAPWMPLDPADTGDHVGTPSPATSSAASWPCWSLCRAAARGGELGRPVGRQWPAIGVAGLSTGLSVAVVSAVRKGDGGNVSSGVVIARLGMLVRLQRQRVQRCPHQTPTPLVISHLLRVLQKMDWGVVFEGDLFFVFRVQKSLSALGCFSRSLQSLGVNPCLCACTVSRSSI